MPINDALQDVISTAIEDGVATEEIMFELAKCFVLLAYASNCDKANTLGAVGDLLDVIYDKADKVMEGRGAGLQ